MKLRLGTRGSALALAQARLVAEMLEAEVEVVAITTSGDRGTGPGDKSRFTKELEEALLRDEIDVAVHSAKDVPAELPEGLAIVAVPERADARDALCGAGSLDDLDEGAVVGTSSLRRRAQLAALRPDLEVRALRGNVDTRLGKLADGEYDALVLAHAGLERLGRPAAGRPLAVQALVPAAGQGCLLLEARKDRDDLVATAATDAEAVTCLTAERAAVRALGASCHTPVGVHARLDAGGLELHAFVGMPDGSHWIRDSQRGGAADPIALGQRLAERLVAAGAGDLLERLEPAAS